MSRREHELTKIKESMFDGGESLPKELEELAYHMLNINGAVHQNVYGFMVGNETEFDLVKEHFDILCVYTGDADMFNYAHGMGYPASIHGWFEGSAFCLLFTEVVKGS